MIDFELSLCADGASACLAYFDSLCGNDRMFIIKPSGVFEQSWNGDQEVLTPVANLAAALLLMAQQEDEDAQATP